MSRVTRHASHGLGKSRDRKSHPRCGPSVLLCSHCNIISINQLTLESHTWTIHQIFIKILRPAEPKGRPQGQAARVAPRGRVSFVPRAPVIPLPLPILWAVRPPTDAVRPGTCTTAPPPPGLGRLGLGLRRGGLQQLPLELGRRGLEARDRTQQAGERSTQRRHLDGGVLQQQASREGRADAADSLDGVAQPGGEPRLTRRVAGWARRVAGWARRVAGWAHGAAGGMQMCAARR